MTDTLKKITHLQAAIRQLADQGTIKPDTKTNITLEVFYPEANKEIEKELQEVKQ